MWELDYKENWVPKNWCFWTVVLEKTLESPLDCREIQPIHPKGNQSWIFIGRTDAVAETPIIQLPDAKNWLIWINPEAGKDWRWEKGTTENEMVGQHLRLNGHDFWVVSGSWWWTGRPGVLQSMGSQRVRHNWVTELNWTEPLNFLVSIWLKRLFASFHTQSIIAFKAKLNLLWTAYSWIMWFYLFSNFLSFDWRM